MPLVYQQNINDDTKLGVWHITEAPAFFSEEIEMIHAIKNQDKAIQFLAGRCLLRQLFSNFPIKEIKIAQSKKPYLPKGQFQFSISHSGRFAAAIISKKNKAGIDIELPQPRINAIKHKFVNDEESLILSALSLEDDHQYTLAWAIKEAVFKWYGDGKVNYKEHISILSIYKEDNVISGIVVFKKLKDELLKVKAIFFEGHYLVWVL